MSVEADIRTGVAMLDAHRPGWEDQVNLDVLDLSSGSHCVIAQVFAPERAASGTRTCCDFHYGWRLLGMSDGDVYDLGFGVDSTHNLHQLNKGWKEFITARRLQKRTCNVAPKELVNA